MSWFVGYAQGVEQSISAFSPVTTVIQFAASAGSSRSLATCSLVSDAATKLVTKNTSEMATMRNISNFDLLLVALIGSIRESS